MFFMKKSLWLSLTSIIASWRSRINAVAELPTKNVPLPIELVGMSVDVEVRGNELDVYYNRELRARYDFQSGKELSLDESIEQEVDSLSSATPGDD